MSKRPRTPQAPLQEPLKALVRKAFCITNTNVTEHEKIIMLANAIIGDNLHDFAGSRSDLDDKKIFAITNEYTDFLIKAKNEEAIHPKRTLYLELINAIKNSTTIDKDLRKIYEQYFNNHETEPEIEWSFLDQLNIKDNFEVIIGNKKALLNLTTPDGNKFLNTLRPIIQRNTHFEGNKIHFVIDVSTIGNNVFVDEHSKICKGTANYFDDFYRPSPTPADFRYISKEINFNVNILDTISKQNACKLNHLALTDFRIEDRKIKWNNNKIIDIDSTTPSEFGVSKYSTLILESRKTNPTKAELLKRFKDITGLDNKLLNSNEYGKYIFDFKRLMDSSQIMYTYHLNKQQDDTKYIFVTHDNMAAVIARLIGVPYIHTHVNGSIRSISVHLGTTNIIEKNVITNINNGIFQQVIDACRIDRPAIPAISNTPQNIVSNVIQDQLNDFVAFRKEGKSFDNLRIDITLRWILGRYVNFLNNAKSNLEKYIRTIKNTQNPNQSYAEFKIKKDTNEILNINYTVATLNSDYMYISTLIDAFNRFKDMPEHGSLSKQFYEIIKNDSGYLFSTLDFKMLVYCLMTDLEKVDIQPDFDTTYFAGIQLTTNEQKINENTSHKIILKRFFKNIIELYPTKVIDTTPAPASASAAKKARTKQGGVMEGEDEYVELVEAFIESIKNKNDLKAYAEAINSRASAPAPVRTITSIRPEHVTDVKMSPRTLPKSAPRSRSRLRPESATKRLLTKSAARFASPSLPRWKGGEETQRYQFYEDFLTKLKL